MYNNPVDVDWTKFDGFAGFRFFRGLGDRTGFGVAKFTASFIFINFVIYIVFVILVTFTVTNIILMFMIFMIYAVFAVFTVYGYIFVINVIFDILVNFVRLPIFHLSTFLDIFTSSIFCVIPNIFIIFWQFFRN